MMTSLDCWIKKPTIISYELWIISKRDGKSESPKHNTNLENTVIISHSEAATIQLKITHAKIFKFLNFFPANDCSITMSKEQTKVQNREKVKDTIITNTRLQSCH
jgi:hypothetical protein